MSPKGTSVAPGSRGPKPVAELLAAVEGQRAGGQAVEGVVGVEDAGAPGGVAGELDRGLHRLGARVAEEDPADPGVGPRRPAPRPAGRAGARSPSGPCSAGRGRWPGAGPLDGRVGPAEGVDAEAGQKVEVALALVVVEVAALAPHVEAVEPEGLEDPDQLGVHVLGVEREVLAVAVRRTFATSNGICPPSSVDPFRVPVRRCPSCRPRPSVLGHSRRIGPGRAEWIDHAVVASEPAIGGPEATRWPDDDHQDPSTAAEAPHPERGADARIPAGGRSRLGRLLGFEALLRWRHPTQG